MSTEPNTVQFATIDAALALIGLDDRGNITRVTIDPFGITVERCRVDDSGRVVVAGNHVATATTVIGIKH